MTAESILILYLLFFAGELIFENILSFLNIRNIQRYSDAVPEDFRDCVDLNLHRKQGEYTKAHLRWDIVSSICSGGFVLLIVLSGALGRLDLLIGKLALPQYIHGIIYLFSVTLIFRIFSLPFSIYSQFVIENRYGFNTTTGKLFTIDLIKGLALSAILAFPILYGTFRFIDAFPDYWWLYTFIFITLVQLVISIIYPLIIAPLFNKFTPLEDGPLKDTLTALARKLSFRTRGIFVMDGSRRSRHSNAYFTGLGKSKRIVLFDTLINSLTEDQVTAVLSHEIGHEKRRHVLKRLAVSSMFLLLGLYIISLLMGSGPLFSAFGFSGTSPYGIFVILMFCASPFTFMLTPLMTAWSRKHEYDADRFAVNAMGGAEGLKSGLITLSKENLSNLTPHKLYSFYHYSHPTLSERISAMEKTAEEIRGGEGI